VAKPAFESSFHPPPRLSSCTGALNFLEDVYREIEAKSIGAVESDIDHYASGRLLCAYRPHDTLVRCRLSYRPFSANTSSDTTQP
jgi:hypothetical protein